MTSHGLLLAAAAVVLASRVFLSLLVIPPWQHPDENSHVALVELQKTRIAGADAPFGRARESEILKSMIDYGWWEHRGRSRPEELPATFDSAGYGVGVSPTGTTVPLYHLAAGRMLGWLPTSSVVDDLYVLRAASGVMGLLTLWVAWLATRECLGPSDATVIAALVALHPQFVVVSTGATPDALVNLLGACLWWQTARAVNATRLLRPLAIVWGAALLGASADRMGVPLLAIASIASITVLALAVRFRRWKVSLAVLFSLLVAAAAFAAAIWALRSFGRTFALDLIFSSAWMPVSKALTSEFFAAFTASLHQSWWLSLGWMRYSPPAWWTAIAVALAASSGIGLGLRFLKGRDNVRTRTLIALAAAALVIQVLAVYWTYFRFGYGAQGKSLFPVLVPSLILLWAGIEGWVPPAYRARAAVALVAVFAVLDGAAWTLVALPAYAGL